MVLFDVETPFDIPDSAAGGRGKLDLLSPAKKNRPFLKAKGKKGPKES